MSDTPTIYAVDIAEASAKAAAAALAAAELAEAAARIHRDREFAELELHAERREAAEAEGASIAAFWEHCEAEAAKRHDAAVDAFKVAENASEQAEFAASAARAAAEYAKEAA